MKRKLVGRMGVTALVLTFVSMTLMGATLAKYTTEVSGSATATVAKFAFDLNGTTEKTENKTISFDDLFSNTYNDGKVKAADNKNVVAPGTSGKVAIVLENTGEVEIQPDFTITETNAGNIPLQYAITTADQTPADGDWKAAGDLAPTETAVTVGNTKQTFYLHWRWNTDTDAKDTALGIAGTAAAKLEIQCTVTQAVPTSTTPASA